MSARTPQELSSGIVVPSTTILAGTGIAAFGVGVLAHFQPTLAVGLMVGAAVVLACVYRQVVILAVLVFSLYLEVVAFGGVTVTRLVAPLAVLFVVTASGLGSARLRTAQPLVWAGGFSGWALASLLWTTDDQGTVFLLGSLAIAAVFMIAFGALIGSERDLRVVLSVIVAASFLVGALGVLSFLNVFGAIELEEGRTSGTTGDANFFAAYQLVALPITLLLALEARRPLARAVLLVAVVTILVSIFATVSRGGLVALAAILLIAIVLPSRTVFRRRRVKVAVVTVIVAAAAVMFQAFSGTFAPRFEEISSGGGSGREILWQGAWTSVKERPALGLGFGAFLSSANELILRTPNVSLRAYDLLPDGEEVHNAYLGVLTELGLPGLVLFLGLIFSTGRQLRRTSAAARVVGEGFVSRVAGAVFLSLIGWATASIFLSSETSRPLWMIVGISLALPKLLEDSHGRPREVLAGSGLDHP